MLRVQVECMPVETSSRRSQTLSEAVSMTSNTHQTHRHTDTQTHDLLAGGNGLEVHVGCCVNHRQLQRVVYLCMHACTALRMCPWHGMHTFMSLCLSVCLSAVCKHECMKAFHVSPAPAVHAGRRITWSPSGRSLTMFFTSSQNPRSYTRTRAHACLCACRNTEGPPGCRQG